MKCDDVKNTYVVPLETVIFRRISLDSVTNISAASKVQKLL